MDLATNAVDAASSVDAPQSSVGGGRDSNIAEAIYPAPASIDQLKEIARRQRRRIVAMTSAVNSGHPGGSLSSIDLLTALYVRFLRHRPHEPGWPDRDRFILSKGHCCPALYAILAETGYFPEEELSTFRRIDSRLQGHAHIKTPGVEMSSGSLGQGLSFGVGTALAARLDSGDQRVFVLLGDGECDEGQVWEAAMAATHYGLRNLYVIIDRNGIQNDRTTSEVMEIEPLDEKWRAFRWNVEHVDGHDMGKIVRSMERVTSLPGPTAIIAKTVKGKDVSFMENNPAYHGKAATGAELELALEELA